MTKMKVTAEEAWSSLLNSRRNEAERLENAYLAERARYHSASGFKGCMDFFGGKGWTNEEIRLRNLSFENVKNDRAYQQVEDLSTKSRDIKFRVCELSNLAPSEEQKKIRRYLESEVFEPLEALEKRFYNRGINESEYFSILDRSHPVVSKSRKILANTLKEYRLANEKNPFKGTVEWTDYLDPERVKER